MQTKSATTGVAAPKNANSNCRQTTKKRQVYLVPQLEGICVFTKFKKVVVLQKEYKYPLGQIYLLFFIKGCLAFSLYHLFPQNATSINKKSNRKNDTLHIIKKGRRSSVPWFAHLYFCGSYSLIRLSPDKANMLWKLLCKKQKTKTKIISVFTLVRETGLDSRRGLRGLVVRGSDSPPDCHSLPLLLQALSLLKKKKGKTNFPFPFLVRVTGLEPAQPCDHKNLNLTRLPIPPRPHIKLRPLF